MLGRVRATKLSPHTEGSGSRRLPLETRNLLENDINPSEQQFGSGRVSHEETCLFWRCARHVLEGDPASDNVVVCVPGRNGGNFPLLGFSLTRKRNLICWPILPGPAGSTSEVDHCPHLDHVTLGLKTGHSHSTMYESDGCKAHPQEWKVMPLPLNGVSLWFGIAVQLSTIENQILERHQWIKMPTPDVDRRSQEYRNFFEKLRFVDANVAANPASGKNALVAFVYLVDRSEVKLSEDLLAPFNEWPVEFWDHRADDRVSLNVLSTGLAIGSAQLGLLIGIPSSTLREQGPIMITPTRNRTTLCT